MNLSEIRQLQEAQGFWVLVLTEPRARLLRGLDERLLEFEEGGFPVEHSVQEGSEERVASSSALGGGRYSTSYGGQSGNARLPGDYAPDISHYRDEHLRQFFREADQALSKVFGQDPLPVIVAGTSRNIALFMEVSAHGERIAGTIEGSYDKTWSRDLFERCKPIGEEIRAQEVNAALAELEGSVGANRYASGALEVWQMAKAGRCRTVLLERDYACFGRLQADGEQLELVDDCSGADVVSEIVEGVIASRGKILFVDQGVLAQHKKVAAVLRY
ncbi:MAG: hypothetical protein AB7W16_14485 [Candidatus Obscuribacterales bacterium]